MHKLIDEVEFTIFDTETTGLDPKSGDRIVEIAGLRCKGREKISSFQTLVNPHRDVSEGAFMVNRISSDMLKDAPDMKNILPGFLNFIKGSCLCSYNAGFDLEFLNNELMLSGKEHLDEHIVVVDILKMARRILPGMERYALWFVAESLGIKIQQEHRAFSDVELASCVFTVLKEEVKRKGIVNFRDFQSLFSINPLFLNDIINQRIAMIQEAIDLKVKLKIKYLASSDASISEREVIPKEIRQEKKNTYLIGYCCLRNDERNFRVDGILHIEII